MSALSYLQALSKEVLFKPGEKAKLERSLLALEQRLVEHFDSDRVQSFQFGSAIRGTSIPLAFSDFTDIDYMVVFRDADIAPRAYLDRLMVFSRKYYPRSVVRQATPAIVIELAHTTFELVPALEAFWNDFKIPSTSGAWTGSNPRGLELDMVQRNKACDGMLKPAIRLAKLWNVAQGHVFSSFELEKQAIALSYPFINNIRDYFYAILEGLSLDMSEADWRHERLALAKKYVQESRTFERDGLADKAVSQLKKLFG